jgi:hypothetical protein
MFGERLRKANRIATRRLNRRRERYPFWYHTGPNAEYLNRKLHRHGYYRKFHDKNHCPEGPCTWCCNPVKFKGWWKKRNFWIRDIDEWFAWPMTPTPDNEAE